MIARTLAGLTGFTLMVFGFMGFAVAAMAGVEFPAAEALAMAAAEHSRGAFMLWLSTGLWSMALCCYAAAGTVRA